MALHPSWSNAQTKKEYCLSKIKDRDKDFISDCDEVSKTKTNPKKKDSDKDGIADGNEDKNSNNRQNEDEDDNKKYAKDAPGNKDSDHDCLQNEDEDDFGLQPKIADSDGDGIVDGLEDSDGDGILNKDEDDFPGEGMTEEDIACISQGSPTPTPPPSSGSGTFDSDGNVTSAGKSLLKIPGFFSANILKGYIAHNKYSCSACHGEKGGFTYDRLAVGVSQEPMDTLGITSQELADLTAYLNRGR